ncbi:glycosyltransferase family 2 protein [Aestuariivirga litoralis]|uniref:Glycosyltransferase family 2 protein n=1 Tax=Aestuariivirga litoralis TaxID=2650924 RepID=A0A2W2CF57_9HYPH|nr:glycosyltransferase family 2 protein [Aestuariivirga litoralis]PZF78793.1 glycosyltransferase family 2 protein [Aestuariivirga litoralis]
MKQPAPRAGAPNLTVIILTRDEELHIERALASVSDIASRCIVVDSGSTDRTLALAKAAGAEVWHHDWLNHAAQFNWALAELPPGTGWVLRLDADETVTPALATEIRQHLAALDGAVTGVVVGRRMTFLGRPIRWGGLFPVPVLRLIRHGHGRCESRWMDEHLVTDGRTASFAGEIIDDNRKPLGWWIDKHNGYAAREVVDILSREHGLGPQDNRGELEGHARGKRWMKTAVYARLPSGARAVLYFLYRYVLRLGFLDGYEGLAFHALQGFWYRFLVDAKLFEVRAYMARTGAPPADAIRAVLGIDLAKRG